MGPSQRYWPRKVLAEYEDEVMHRAVEEYWRKRLPTTFVPVHPGLGPMFSRPGTVDPLFPPGLSDLIADQPDRFSTQKKTGKPKKATRECYERFLLRTRTRGVLRRAA